MASTVLNSKKLVSPEAIIFDKDGTLLSLCAFWEPVSREAILEILRKYSLPETLVEKILIDGGFDNGHADIRGVLSFGTFEEIAELFASALSREGRKYDMNELVAETKAAFDKYLSLGVIAPTCAGLRETLTELREHGIKLAVVTTDRIESTMLALRELGIQELFDEVITADRMAPKPDPAGINYLAEKYGIDKSKMMMVGDTFTDTEFAKRGGIFSVAVADTEENQNLLSSHADAVIAKISDIFDCIQTSDDFAP